MYELGLAKYSDFLGNSCNPKEVFIKSCTSDRCIESALVSALYPPNDNWFSVMMQHAMTLLYTGNRLLFKQFD